jgi:hypothetical protein
MEFHPTLPTEVESWGKVRIANGGDCMRMSSMGANCAERDQSFVWVRSHLIYYLLVMILESQFDLHIDIHACKPKQPPVFES